MATFPCSLCKQDCPYVQGNVFTAGDKKFCANCYRLLAEKQKERQQAAAAAAAGQQPTPAQPPAVNPTPVSPREQPQTTPARDSPRVAAPASWGERGRTNTVSQAAPKAQEPAPVFEDRPQEVQQPATNTTAPRPRQTVGAGATPSPFSASGRIQSQMMTNSNPPAGGDAMTSSAGTATRRAPPSWQTRSNTTLTPPGATTSDPQQASPRATETAKPQPTAPVQQQPTPTPAAAATDEEDYEPGKPKKRLIDQMQDIKIEDTTFSRYKKSQEASTVKKEVQPYRGGPWQCPGCKSRQVAATCQMCGHASPTIVPLTGQQEKAKKVIDPDDPFSHIDLVSWDEAPGHIKRW